MRTSDDAAYLFRRAREEALKADKAAGEGADPAVIAIRRELALRYKARALSLSGVASEYEWGTRWPAGSKPEAVAQEKKIFG